LVTNASAHTPINEGEHVHIFNQCETKEKIDTLNQPPVSLKLKPPRYPQAALRRGKEGGVLVEFDVDEEGKVINPKVKWSENKLFDHSALKSVSSWVFKPALENGKPIPYKGFKRFIYFIIDGNENTLNLGIGFDSIVKEVRTGLRTGKVEKPVKKIDSLLAGENLEENTRAGLLYLKAMSLYKIKAPNKEIMNLLIESKQHQDKGITSMKMQTFGGILLGQMYLDESNYQKAEEELSEAILASRGSGLKSRRFYQAYLQLGLASYTQQKWCLASKSWEKAKILANEYQITFPEQLADPFEYAQSKNPYKKVTK
jgi:TonB family protein